MMEFFLNSSGNIVQRSKAKRSENGAKTKLISDQQQGRSTARSTNMHKAESVDCPVDQCAETCTE